PFAVRQLLQDFAQARAHPNTHLHSLGFAHFFRPSLLDNAYICSHFVLVNCKQEQVMSVINIAGKLKEFEDHDGKLVAEVLHKLKGVRIEWCRKLAVYLNNPHASNEGVQTILAGLLVERIEKLSERRRLDINLIANQVAQILSELPHRGSK